MTTVQKIQEIEAEMARRDLFGMEDCSNCDGSGQIKYIEEDRIEDCDICNK